MYPDTHSCLGREGGEVGLGSMAGEGKGGRDGEMRMKDGSCGGREGQLRDDISPCFNGKPFRFPLVDITRRSFKNIFFFCFLLTDLNFYVAHLYSLAEMKRSYRLFHFSIIVSQTRSVLHMCAAFASHSPCVALSCLISLSLVSTFSYVD